MIDLIYITFTSAKLLVVSAVDMLIDVRNSAEAETQLAAWASVTICDKSFETPNFWDLHTRLSSDTTTHLPHTKPTLQGASSHINASTPKFRLEKGAANVFLFTIWSKFWNSQVVIVWPLAQPWVTRYWSRVTKLVISDAWSYARAPPSLCHMRMVPVDWHSLPLRSAMNSH